MSAVELIALASTASLLAGWRLYLVTLVTGLAMKFGWIDLPERLQALDVIANNTVIGIAAVGTVAEFFADKVAWVDSAWDAIHSFIRPLGGALLSLAIIDQHMRGISRRMVDATGNKPVFRRGKVGARHPSEV